MLLGDTRPKHPSKRYSIAGIRRIYGKKSVGIWAPIQIHYPWYRIHLTGASNLSHSQQLHASFQLRLGLQEKRLNQTKTVELLF